MNITDNMTEEESGLNSPELPNNILLPMPEAECLYLNNTGLPSVDYVQSKIEEFSNLFNSTYRIPMLNCNSTQKENLTYLLIFLKKSVKYALQEMGRSLTKKQYKFRCTICDEQININPGENFWSSLQDHEHFEELYYRFLNNELKITNNQEEFNLPSSPESESNILEDAATTGESNPDSGIDQPDIEPSTSGIQKLQRMSTPPKQDSTDPDDVNSFRFNFSLTYDEAVEAKIYPSSIMLGVRRYDKVKEYTIMRAGHSKAACLICYCEINGMRVTKHMLVNHAMGQKHFKAATTPFVLGMLMFYHEFWVKQEPEIQAHQVYFRPDIIPKLRCALCFGIYDADKIVLHILSDIHKKKVLDMYEKRTNMYYLINLQIQVYGITQEQFDAREEEFKQKEKLEMKQKEKLEMKQKEKIEMKQRMNSDSDTPDEVKKLANQPQAVSHNIIKSVESPDSSDPLHLLPNRMKGDLKFLKRITKPDRSTIIQCDLCKVTLHDNLPAIKDHIVISAQHNSRKPDKYNYYCEICNIRVMSEVGWKNHDFSGPRHVNMAASRRDKVTEYECTTCKTVIFGDELSLTRHLAVRNRGNRKESREKELRLPDPVKVLFHSKERILAEGAELAGGAEEVLNNSLTRDCCARIQSALSEHIEDCKVYPFGSRITGTGNKDSDLDVFVDVGDMYFGDENQDPAYQIILIRKAYKAFAKNNEYLNLVQVLTARTPILKLHHVPTKLDCDLSFKHGLSVENTKFLRFCIELQPVIQPLILLIKKWAEHINLESITNYALATMCIFFLQLKNYLLSVDTLRKINSTEPRVICGWKTISYLPLEETKKHIKRYPNTVFELLKEFFHYYGKFDFNTHVACPLLGRVIKRTLFTDPDDLPPEMEGYIAQLEGEDPELFRSNSYMCIQDPFDLSHNLTKAVQQGGLTKFQKMCKLSLTHLESIKQ